MSELKKLCKDRGVSVRGGQLKDNYVNTLADVDGSLEKEKKAKHQYADNAPYSIEDVTKMPIGAKISPERAKAAGKTEPEDKIMRRGPTGRPVYDKMGFELDYDKVCRRTRGGFGCRTMGSKAYMKMIDENSRQSDRNAEIMNMDRNKVSAFVSMVWDDRVSRGLGIPYHKVEMQDFEERHDRGFRAEPVDGKNMPESERERITALTTGAAFRK